MNYSFNENRYEIHDYETYCDEFCKTSVSQNATFITKHTKI